MAAAGSAVGLGNIWKFPYETGANGGGAFLLLYLLFIVVFGASLILAEMVLGRASGQNPVGAFRSLGGGRWPLVGYLGVFTGFVILSFYIVIAGWTIAYMGFMLDGSLISGDAESIGAKFSAFISGGATPVLLAGLFMIATVIVVLGGIGKGIERASKLLMPVLFVLLLVLIARSVSLPGAGEGLRFFLVPDWSKVDGGTFTSAIGQAFFSLSLGMGALITYGSYLPKTTPMPGSAAIIVACSRPEPEPSVVTSCAFASPDLPWMSALSDWNPLYNCAFVERMSPRCFANALSTWSPISGERYWPFHVSRSAFDGSFPLSISWRPYGAASGRSARPTTRRERIASAMRRSARAGEAKFD